MSKIEERLAIYETPDAVLRLHHFDSDEWVFFWTELEVREDIDEWMVYIYSIAFFWEYLGVHRMRFSLYTECYWIYTIHSSLYNILNYLSYANELANTFVAQVPLNINSLSTNLIAYNSLLTVSPFCLYIYPGLSHKHRFKLENRKWLKISQHVCIWYCYTTVVYCM